MNFIKPNWPCPNQVKGFTTTKVGWKGSYPYQPQALKGSIESETLKHLLKLPNDPVWLQQIHSNIVIEAKPENIGQVADASFSRQPGEVCVVSSADCLPILICDVEGKQVAAIHAGWRGLANGIIENTLKTFASNKNLMVWYGPAIGPNKFEVGLDVYQAFTQSHPQAKNAFHPIANEKWLGNLYQLATLRLESQGIGQIYGGDYCTHTQDQLFYSYRRDKGLTGRMATLVWIEDN